MELQSENDLVKWSVPECPFTVEYSPRVLDDIRLAVTDAFFSLPRGGAEIGGLLLGRQEKGRIAILDSMPMECEHAFGPSFVLSDRDHAKLSELVAAANRNPHLKSLGWWHSHTRSEIFLSEADQQIHNTFFPEPWQVAVVLKPHTFQPTRAGIFFREAGGSMRGESTYGEILLEPLPMRPAGPPAPPPMDGPALGAADRGGRVVDVVGFAAPAQPVEEPAPEAPAREVTPPSFLTSGETAAKPPRRWIGWVAAAFGIAFAIFGFSTRDRWLPSLQPRLQPAANEAIALNTIDQQGELQIRWNGAAPPVRTAEAGNLLIVDGTATVSVPLDAPHVQSGAFTYRRRSDRVDVTLALTQPGGNESRVATLFTGDPPPQPTPHVAPAEPASNNTALRDELKAAEAANASLKLDLARQMERNKALEKAMEELRKVVRREQQRKRLEAQTPDAGK